MPVGRTLILGSPYIGVYVRSGEAAAIVAPSVANAVVRDVERLLSVRAIRTTISGSEIVGALAAVSSHGVVVGSDVDDEEADALRPLGRVVRLRTRHNALGNNILVNDTGAIVHPEFGDEAIARISEALGVPARRGTIAGLGTVGMAAVATNKGAVIHPRATPTEAEVVESALGVPVHRSTANFGVPIVGACLTANSRALVTGRPTTPVEIVHLQEGLSVFD